MKSVIILSIFVLLPLLNIAQKTEILTNETIIAMCNSGLSPSIVISKIKKTKSNFKTETQDLIKLKQQKVPDEVISAIIEASYSSSEDFGDKENPLNNQKSGIYYFDIKNNLIELESAITSSVITSMTGFGKTGSSVKLESSMSRFQIFDKKPTFYFYFDKSSNINDLAQGNFFNSTTSPAEFSLVKFTTNTRARGIQIMSASAYTGTRLGLPEKQIIPFDIEKVNSGIYKVTPRNNIESGEYCFMHSNSGQSSYGGVRVFDFGVNDIPYRITEENGFKRFEVYDIANNDIEDSLNHFLGFAFFKSNRVEFNTRVLYNRNLIITKQTEGKNFENGERKSEFKHIKSINASNGSTLTFRDLFEKEFTQNIKDMIVKQSLKEGCQLPKKFDLYNNPISVDDSNVYFNIGCNCGQVECQNIEKPIIIPITKVDQFMISSFKDKF